LSDKIAGQITQDSQHLIQRKMIITLAH